MWFNCDFRKMMILMKESIVFLIFCGMYNIRAFLHQFSFNCNECISGKDIYIVMKACCNENQYFSG